MVKKGNRKETFSNSFVTYKDFFGGLHANHAAEIPKVGRTDLADVKQRINAERCESIQEYGLGHVFSNEWSHFAKELNEEVGREKKDAASN